MQIIKETTEQLIKDDPKKHTQRVNSEDPETMISELVKWTNMSSESVQHIPGFEILPSSPREYKLKVTKCLYARTVRDMDAADLGYQWICSNDYVIAETLHPKIMLTRTKTLMQGDDCCEFHYT